ncbi:hypothetical protein KAU55_04725 [Candidatus Bathyarchaeota archaeon]|nr:hypothetical protein [Candidatus Bathyarchaeota archaeon]
METLARALFFLALLPGVIRIYQGEIADGAEIIVNATSDEIISITYQSIVIGVLIAIFSALGLTSVVALLKKI